MSGLNITITTVLLFNVLIVQGKFYQKDDLMEENRVKRYHEFNSVDGFYSGSNSAIINDDVPTRNDFRGLNFKKKVPKWLKFGLEHNGVRSGRPYGGDPSDMFIGLGDRGKKCQNIEGLPRPESGCCGVQLTRSPNGRFPGKPLWRPAIFGGKPTDLHQFPWVVRLSINPENPDFGKTKSCGGTIISFNYVLTAAHCVHKTYKNIKQLEVFLAEYDTSSYPKDCVGSKCITNVLMKVDHVIIHPKYNDTYLNNDVALIRLSSEIPYTDFIRPICLPTADIKELKEEVESFVIAGWGLDGRIESNLKQAANVNYVSNEECKAQNPFKDDGMFCSIGGHREDICHGDSGGPLMAYHMDKYYLSGVVTGKRKDQECGSSVPSIFNDVFYHLRWITKHVK